MTYKVKGATSKKLQGCKWKDSNFANLKIHSNICTLHFSVNIMWIIITMWIFSVNDNVNFCDNDGEKENPNHFIGNLRQYFIWRLKFCMNRTNHLQYKYLHQQLIIYCCVMWYNSFHNLSFNFNEHFRKLCFDTYPISPPPSILYTSLYWC